MEELSSRRGGTLIIILWSAVPLPRQSPLDNLINVTLPTPCDLICAIWTTPKPTVMINVCKPSGIRTHYVEDKLPDLWNGLQNPHYYSSFKVICIQGADLLFLLSENTALICFSKFLGPFSHDSQWRAAARQMESSHFGRAWHLCWRRGALSKVAEHFNFFRVDRLFLLVK